MMRLLVTTSLALWLAFPVFAQPVPSDQTSRAGRDVLAANDSEPIRTGALANPVVVADATASKSVMRRPNTDIDSLNEPHRKYTRIEDYWADR
jgi:hypothetical protein